MNEPRINPLWLDRGLVEISHARGDAASLPSTRQLDPAASLAAPQLDALLASPGFGAVLEAELQPQLADRALLLPAAFRHALGSAHELLRAAAERQPEQASVWQRAARVVAEDLALRELAQMYRGVLHQG